MHYIKKENNQKISLFRLRIYLWLSLIVLTAIALIYVVIYSSFFQVKKIEVKNNKDITDKELLANLEFLINKNWLTNLTGDSNMFFWPRGELVFANSLIAKVYIDKSWINRSIEINVKGRERFAIWCFNDGKECYWFDKNGIFFGKSPLAENGSITVIFDSKINSGAVLGKTISEERFIKNIIAILNNIQNSKIQISKILYNDALNEMIINAVAGPQMLFSTRFDQTNSFEVIKNLMETGQYDKLAYIDLRIENKAFIK